MRKIFLSRSAWHSQRPELDEGLPSLKAPAFARGFGGHGRISEAWVIFLFAGNLGAMENQAQELRIVLRSALPKKFLELERGEKLELDLIEPFTQASHRENILAARDAHKLYYLASVTEKMRRNNQEVDFQHNFDAKDLLRHLTTLQDGVRCTTNPISRNVIERVMLRKIADLKTLGKIELDGTREEFIEYMHSKYPELAQELQQFEVQVPSRRHQIMGRIVSLGVIGCGFGLCKLALSQSVPDSVALIVFSGSFVWISCGIAAVIDPYISSPDDDDEYPWIG